MKPKRKPRPARCPTMVAMLNNPEVELTARLALESFPQGWAGVAQFDVLATCRDLLTVAVMRKHDVATYAVCDLAGEALLSIKARWLSMGKMGATGDELQALRALIEVSEDWWKRTSGEAVRLAHAALDADRSRLDDAT